MRVPRPILGQSSSSSPLIVLFHGLGYVLLGNQRPGARPFGFLIHLPVAHASS